MHTHMAHTHTLTQMHTHTHTAHMNTHEYIWIGDHKLTHTYMLK